MKDFFNFKKMLIPIIIQVGFRIGLCFCLIMGISQIVQITRFFTGTILWQEILLIGIIWFVIYPILLRIVSEVLIILFSINDNLISIKNLLKSQVDSDNQTN